ncbi:MAG: DUF521 domain-containing protein, partial [Nitrososphaerota archaeon]|nr:DUF521 domain-containing protein [Nitrososphaerota archaeon]
MELTKEEEASLKGENGESLQLAYRILVATGEATDAEKLVPIEWAHVSGVNYNTIGDAGEEFLSNLSKDAKVKVKTTVNPMGYDIDNVSNYNLDEEFIKNKEKIIDYEFNYNPSVEENYKLLKYNDKYFKDYPLEYFK